MAEGRGKGHGRVEIRRLRATTRLNEYLDWPGVRQVCVIERVRKVGGREGRETVGAITSLGPERASAARLLRVARQHWEIEDRLHWVRDVCCGEDDCRVRRGDAPRVLSGQRNAVLYVLRATGLARIGEAFRRHAAKPEEAVQKVVRPLPAEL